MNLSNDGARHIAALFDIKDVRALIEALDGSDQPKAGQRIAHSQALARWIGPGSTLCGLVAREIGVDAKPVRAILFDKGDAANWALGWHQDRTIAVSHRADVNGFTCWTVKDGVQHTEPPFALLERMITARVHIDRVPADNAPLKVICGSHALGRLFAADVERIAKNSPTVACLAEVGDVWLYRTPILHASDRAAPGKRRRVLQIDYSADLLPGPLGWAFA